MPTSYSNYMVTDGVDTVLAGQYNRVLTSALLAAMVNVETLSATRALDDNDFSAEMFNCNGANRIVTLPYPSAANHPFYIYNNTTSGAWTLQVNDYAGTPLAILVPGECRMFISNITGYFAFPMAATSGWTRVLSTWTYASPTTINVPSGAASIYTVGQRIQITQTTVKYFYVVAVADTLLTVRGGSNYSVANAAITAPAYSNITNPVGFPDWLSVTNPTWTTSGTAFTNAPAGGTVQFRMAGPLVIVRSGIWACNAISGGTGVFIATFTAGQLPPIATYQPGVAININTNVLGVCRSHGSNDLLYLHNYAGTALATNSENFSFAIQVPTV